MKSHDWSVSLFFFAFLIIFNGVTECFLDILFYGTAAVVIWMMLFSKASRKTKSVDADVKADGNSVKTKNAGGVKTTSIG